MAEAPLPQRNTIDRVEESRIFGYDSANDEFVALTVEDGKLAVDADLNTESIDVTDRSDRLLGSVDVSELPEPVTVTQNGTVDVSQTAAIDVSNLPEPVTVDQNGTVAVQNAPDTELVVDHPGRIDVGDRTGRVLGHVEVDTLPEPVTVTQNGTVDVSSLPEPVTVDQNGTVTTEPATPADADAASLSTTTVAAGESVTLSLSALGAEAIVGRVEVGASYIVSISWQQDGTELFRDAVGSGTEAGQVQIDEQAIAPEAVVEITNDGTAQADVVATLHQR